MKRTVIAAALGLGLSAAHAGDIIEECANVKAPAVLPLKAVTINPGTTAFLLLDFVKPNCTNRPRCLAQMPMMKKLLGEARAHKVAIVYSTAGKATAKDILPDVAPAEGEPVVHASVDKFQGTDLATILKDKGVTTVIVTGTAAHGAVLYTGSAAALRGMNVIVPVDGMSSEDLYYEQATAWLLAKGTGGIGPRVTLTRSDMIKF
jgi:nicotinamidase-related amidase